MVSNKVMRIVGKARKMDPVFNLKNILARRMKLLFPAGVHWSLPFFRAAFSLTGT